MLSCPSPMQQLHVLYVCAQSEVQYIDYGNVAEVADCAVMMLPDKFAGLPSSAQRYWLLGYQESGHQAEEVVTFPCGLRGCKNRPTPFPGRMS